jgi:hypothetical protein
MCCEEFRRKVVQKFGGAIAGDYFFFENISIRNTAT